MRICLLASGSKGNSLFIEAGDTRLLVDAGLSARELTSRLAAIGVAVGDVNGILITHEHTDHIRGAGALARKNGIPVLISYPTSRQTAEHFRATRLIEFESGCSFAFRDFLVDPFPITHDTADPVGVVIECREGRIGSATDLGIATRLVRDKLRDCRALVLESNHDEEMLANGPYPWHLKQRIRSRHGHLSNRESVDLLEEIIHADLEALFLAHLSEVNNLPGAARQAFTTSLAGRTECRPQLIVGAQHCVSDVYES